MFFNLRQIEADNEIISFVPLMENLKTINYYFVFFEDQSNQKKSFVNLVLTFVLLCVK